jgi:hypothetical protein
LIHWFKIHWLKTMNARMVAGVSTVALLALMPVALKAQQQPVPAVANVSEQNQDAPLAVPVTMNGQGGSLEFISETPTESYFGGGIGLTGSYTDNALLTNTNKLDNFSYYVQPHITWSQITPRFTWNLGASGGVIFNNNLTNQNQAAENADLGASWRLTQHATLRVDDTFTNTTGLFSSIGVQTPGTGVGTVQQGNNTLLVPPAQRTLSNLSLAELSDQVGPNTVVGVRGTYWLLDYPSSSQSTEFGTLYNTRSYSVEAFYDWRFAARQWVGATVRAQRFQTLPDIATTNAGGLILYYSFQASKNVTLTIFGGPDYADTPQTAALGGLGLSGQGRFWTSSEGATLNWGGARTSANVTYSRQLNDGGGLASAVTLQNVSGKLRQQLTRRGAEVQFGAADSKSEPIGVSSGSGVAGLEGISVFALLQQRFSKSFFAQAGYSWQRQDVPGTVGSTAASSNRVWFTVSYDFMKPIGK